MPGLAGAPCTAPRTGNRKGFGGVVFFSAAARRLISGVWAVTLRVPAGCIAGEGGDAGIDGIGYCACGTAQVGCSLGTNSLGCSGKAPASDLLCTNPLVHAPNAVWSVTLIYCGTQASQSSVISQRQKFTTKALQHIVQTL